MANTTKMTEELDAMMAKLKALHPEIEGLDDKPLHEVLELAEELEDDHLALRVSLWGMVESLIELGVHQASKEAS